ncbi:MAG: acylphosphatase [Pseudomonadota bacterium]
MMAQKCLHCFVEGRVQGVWFRGATQAQARQLELTGWAKNLSDGRVEVLACGDAAALEQLHQWLHQGPSHARVTRVVRDNIEMADCPTDFRTG